MSTSRRTWQKAEQRVAEWFGAHRNYGSGSCGSVARSRSDSTHELLYIEEKYRERSATRTLHDDAKAKAKKEGKVPVVALVDKSRPGFLLVIHCDDFEEAVSIIEQSRRGAIWRENCNV